MVFPTQTSQFTLDAFECGEWPMTSPHYAAERLSAPIP